MVGLMENLHFLAQQGLDIHKLNRTIVVVSSTTIATIKLWQILLALFGRYPQSGDPQPEPPPPCSLGSKHSQAEQYCVLT